MPDIYQLGIKAYYHSLWNTIEFMGIWKDFCKPQKAHKCAIFFAKSVLATIHITTNNVILLNAATLQKLMKMPFKIQGNTFFSKENLILLDKALSIERKEVSLRSEIFAIIPTIIYINIRWRMQ